METPLTPNLVEDIWIKDDSKNEWCYEKGTNQTVVKMRMKHDFITLIDADQHAKVADRRWYMNGSGYAETAKHTIEGVEHEMLHMLINPDLPQPRDHINRNKLDNRHCNLRYGGDGLNSRNVSLISEGVHEQGARHRWQAQWTGFDRRKCCKYFRWADYPSKEDARLAAVAHRKEMQDAVIAQIEEHHAKYGPGNNPLPRREMEPRANTGMQNLTHIHRGTSKAGIRGQIEIDGNKFNAWFAVATYGDEAAALEAGQRWRDKVKAENPKKPKQSMKKRRVPSVRNKKVPQRKSNTGFKNLSYQRLGTLEAAVAARIGINKEIHTRWFAFSIFANDDRVLSGEMTTQDCALEAGRQWLSEVVANNPTLPRTKKARVAVE